MSEFKQVKRNGNMSNESNTATILVLTEKHKRCLEKKKKKA